MRILFCGDKHLKIGKFELAKQFLGWLNTTIAEQRPDVYVALGDDMDTHAVLRSEILSEYRKHIDYVMSLGIKMYYVVGNHDLSKPSDRTYHSMQTFKNLYPNFTVVDDRIDVDNITFVPYLPNEADFPLDTKEICIAHQTFKGANYGSIAAENGVDPTLVKAELIISGHIHFKQSFDKVVYPGSPYAQSANDVDQIKGLMAFDTTTFKQTFIPCPLPSWRSFCRTVGPEYNFPQLLVDLSAAIKQSPKDNWLLEIEAPKAELTSFLSSKDYREAVKGINLRVKAIFTDRDKGRTSIKATSMAAIVSEYVSTVYDGTLDKEALLSKALDVLSGVEKA